MEYLQLTVMLALYLVIYIPIYIGQYRQWCEYIEIR
jgi:hypothetical protein